MEQAMNIIKKKILYTGLISKLHGHLNYGRCPLIILLF